MSASGWAVQTATGEILIRTVTDERIGAIINYLCAHANILVPRRWNDEKCEAEWKKHKGDAEVIRVSVSEEF